MSTQTVSPNLAIMGISVNNQHLISWNLLSLVILQNLGRSLNHPDSQVLILGLMSINMTMEEIKIGLDNIGGFFKNLPQKTQAALIAGVQAAMEIEADLQNVSLF